MIITTDFSSATIQHTLSELTSSGQGLSTQEVRIRQKQFGRNEIPEARRKSHIIIFFRQFKSILVGVLILAAALSWFTGHKTDAYIILIVVLIDALIGFTQEWRAEKAVISLHKMLVPTAKVIRSDKQCVVNAIELVPGDIIVLEEGDYIPADARLIEVKNLRSTESSLTGESLPVNKTK